MPRGILQESAVTHITLRRFFATLRCARTNHENNCLFILLRHVVQELQEKQVLEPLHHLTVETSATLGPPRHRDAEKTSTSKNPDALVVKLTCPRSRADV